jgi:hypothetical protein
MKTLFGPDIEAEEEQTDRHGNKKSKASHEHLSLFDLRKKGSNNPGFNTDICDLDAESGFNKIEIEAEPATRRTAKEASPDCKTGPFNDPDLLFRVIGRQVNRKSTVEGKEVTSVDATGTACSMSKWGKEKEFDIDQQKAFEAMVASFMLTFHCDVENCGSDTTDVPRLLRTENSTSLRRARLDLEKLCHKTFQAPKRTQSQRKKRLLQSQRWRPWTSGSCSQ